MFGHLHRAITSGSHKPLSLNERLDSTRSDTGFAFAHFVPWRHHTRSKTDAANLFRTNERVHGRDFSQARNTRKADHRIEGRGSKSREISNTLYSSFRFYLPL